MGQCIPPRAIPLNYDLRTIGHVVSKYITGDQILKMCPAVNGERVSRNFVFNVWAPQPAVRLHTKCSSTTATCQKTTAFSDWPCDALGRLHIGDKVR